MFLISVPKYVLILLTGFLAGFLALDHNGDGTDGRDARDGRTDGNTVLEYCWDGEIQFYSTTGTEKYSFTVLLGRRKYSFQGD